MYSNNSNDECLICQQTKAQAFTFWDYFYPRNSPICRNCQFQLNPKLRTLRFDKLKITYVYQYKDAFRQCLWQYKEIGDEALKSVFLYPVRKQMNRLFKNKTLVLIPSHPHKIQQRGFDHLLAMIEPYTDKVIKILHKEDDTEQKRLSKAQRQHIRFVLDFGKLSLVSGHKIVLVDDIMTTGASLMAAYHLLQPYCQQITCFVFAVSPLLLKGDSR